jgi:hypothetical protein
MRRTGGLHSGEKLTSEKGTLANYIRAQEKLSRLGIEGEIEVLGDDLIIFTDTPIDPGDWARSDLQWGFKEEVADSPNFLMKHVPGGFTYVSRMCTSTLQKEGHLEPANMAIMALGIKSRIVQLQGLTEPHPYASAYDEFCLKAGGRVRDAYLVCKGQSIVDLGIVAARGAKTTHDVEEIENLLVTATDNERAEVLRALPSKLTGRRTMQYADLVRLGSEIPVKDAEREISRKVKR